MRPAAPSTGPGLKPRDRSLAWISLTSSRRSGASLGVAATGAGGLSAARAAGADAASTAGVYGDACRGRRRVRRSGCRCGARPLEGRRGLRPRRNAWERRDRPRVDRRDKVGDARSHGHRHGDTQPHDQPALASLIICLQGGAPLRFCGTWIDRPLLRRPFGQPARQIRHGPLGDFVVPAIGLAGSRRRPVRGCAARRHLARARICLCAIASHGPTRFVGGMVCRE